MPTNLEQIFYTIFFHFLHITSRIFSLRHSRSMQTCSRFCPKNKCPEILVQKISRRNDRASPGRKITTIFYLVFHIITVKNPLLCRKISAHLQGENKTSRHRIRDFLFPNKKKLTSGNQVFNFLLINHMVHCRHEVVLVNYVVFTSWSWVKLRC